MNTPPCIRHGSNGIDDPRIRQALGEARAKTDVELDHSLLSLVDYDGQLWATWRSPQLGQQHGAALADAWADAGGERGTLHLTRIDDDYDYQEDCMNDASADAG